MIDIFVVAFVALIIIGIKPVNRLDGFNEEYLSVETCKYYRGIFAVLIILHHLAQITTDGIMLRWFGYSAGRIATAMFFFLSGYGLQKSYIKKGAEYQKRFLVSRLPTVLIPYIIANVVYWFDGVLHNVIYSPKDIILMLINGENLLVKYSWYVISIMGFYLVYWLIMTVCRKKHFLMILCACVYNVMYVLFCHKMGYGNWWYVSFQMIVVGIIWATYQNRIEGFIKEKYYILISIAWVFVLCAFLWSVKYLNWKTDTMYGLLLSTGFAVAMLLTFMKIKVGNKVLKFLGAISFEMYMTQGLFIYDTNRKSFPVDNDFVFALFGIVGTIVSAYILHILFSWILGKYKKLINKV